MALDREREELQVLAAKNGGKLTVDDVIEAARDSSSALHGHFTWRDDKAAEAWRRTEARALIARIRITVLNPEPTVVRCFMSLPQDRIAGWYTAGIEVIADDGMRSQMLDDMLRRIAYWRAQAIALGAPISHALASLQAAATAEREHQSGRRAKRKAS